MGPRADLEGCGKTHYYRDSIPGPLITSNKHIIKNKQIIRIVNKFLEQSHPIKIYGLKY
jgi:hypothetical protein